ncbi:histone-like nucleoid-structuring protein Lsr2 [Streptomyces sp. NPDC057307]|uniref:Lsr2 dimerization domain-containing protein n=1 Tax=Streptomyces sp. NPDC057307 TaxID=3346096 RepID=UPI00363B40E5
MTVFVRVELVDDVDPSLTEDVQTVRLLVPDEDDVEGERYLTYETREVDLSRPSLARLMEALEPFASVSRAVAEPAPVSSGAQVSRKRAEVARGNLRRSTNPERTAWTRRAKAWLRAQGHDIPDKGRVKADLAAQYEAAHPNDPQPS